MPNLRSLLFPPPVWREYRFWLEMRELGRDLRFRDPAEAEESQAVMLIPGFLTGDQALGMMGSWLKRSGHRTCRAGIRLNIDCSEAAIDRLEQSLERFVAAEGEKAFLVGQSRGGCFARVLAVRRPDLVRGIVTLGSPHLDPLAVHPLVWVQGAALATAGSLGLKGVVSHACRFGDCCTAFWRDLGAPFAPRTRFISVYSRSDGIVDWRACLDPAARHAEIDSTHCGMSVNWEAFEILTEALRPRLRSQRFAPAAARAELAA
jgi:pimeloyl-ACP methyl ester carboxylesterase